jgi:hypothetical protein
MDDIKVPLLAAGAVMAGLILGAGITHALGVWLEAAPDQAIPFLLAAGYVSLGVILVAVVVGLLIRWLRRPAERDEASPEIAETHDQWRERILTQLQAKRVAEGGPPVQKWWAEDECRGEV